MADGVAAKANGRLPHVAVGSDPLASVLLKETMMPGRGQQYPEVVVAKVVDVGQRPAVWTRALSSPIPRPLTASDLELVEHSAVVFKCVKTLRHRPGDVKEVAAGDVADRQLLNESFQRSGLPVVLRYLVTHSSRPQPLLRHFACYASSERDVA